jgi:mRNA-degrading endonuclease RelE of RelBE toxin-antitoxin system
VKYTVKVGGQDKDFIETPGPKARKRIKLALRGLQAESGDCLALREKLSGYHRLRVGGYRVLYRYTAGRVIECVFAERRSLAYHVFERDLLSRLRRETK